MSAPRGMTRRSLLAAAAGGAPRGPPARAARPPGAPLAALAQAPARAGVAEPVCFERWVGTSRGTADDASIWGETRTSSGSNGRRRARRRGSSCACRGPAGASAGGSPAGAHGHGPDLSPALGEADGRSGVDRGRAARCSCAAARALERGAAAARGCERRARRARAGARGRPARRRRRRCRSRPRRSRPGPGQPPIIARRAWARGVSHPRVAPEYGAVEMAFVHHTENPNGYTPGEVPAMLRAIYAFHRYVQRLERHRLQLRDRPLRAHLRGPRGRHRRAGRGRARRRLQPRLDRRGGARELLGSADLERRLAQALERLLAWKLSLHGVPAAGRVTVRVNPAGAATAAFPRARTCRCRVSQATATATRPTAPATSSTASCRRIRAGRASAGRAPRAGRRSRWRGGRRAPRRPVLSAARLGLPGRAPRSPGRRSRSRCGASLRRAKSCASRRSPQAVTDAERGLVGCRSASRPARARHLAAGALPRRRGRAGGGLRAAAPARRRRRVTPAEPLPRPRRQQLAPPAT